MIDPLLVEITNYPEDKCEYFELSNHPKKPELGVRKLPFTNKVYIERSDFMEEPVPGFQRLKPEGEVRLMGAYIIKCDEVVKDSEGNIVKLLCSADLVTGNGKREAGPKVKGTVHWLSAEHALDREVRIYNNIFNKENVATLLEDENFDEFLNPESLEVCSNAKIEESLKDARIGEKFQFVRMGYFTLDSKEENVFNRTVALKTGFKPAK